MKYSSLVDVVRIDTIIERISFAGEFFANCLKIDFGGEKFIEFAVTQCTTPTNAVSNC